MPFTKPYHLLKAICVALLFIGQQAYTQNIPVADGVNWVAANNGYTQPINGSAVANVLAYRKVSTTTSNPVDGRGQWYATLNAQASGGDVINQNMAGGTGDGFLLTSGGGAGNPGTYANIWGVASPSAFAINSVSQLTSNNYEPVVEAGANMSTSGYYTFVMQDSGVTKKNNVYIGYTSNAPISFAHITANQRWVLSDRSVLLVASLSANLSAQENIYVRYKTATNDFSTGTSSIAAVTRVSGDSAIFILPSQTAGATLYYYFFTSTLSLTAIQALTEGNRSLACLKVNDNGGGNYSQLIPAAATIYNHAFANTFSNPYTTAPGTLAAGLSSSSWSCSGGFVASNTGGVSNSAALSPTNGIAAGSVTLTLNVGTDTSVSISNFNFWASSGTGGNLITSVTVNGTPVAGNLSVRQNANAGNGAHSFAVSTPISNVTGTLTIVLYLSGTGTFYLDNFSFTGSVSVYPTFLGYTWTGATSTNWGTATNWSPGGVPGSSDRVYITTPGTNALNVTGSQNAKSITLSGTGALVVSGNLTTNDIVLSGSNSIQITGAVTASNYLQNATGSLVMTSGATLTVNNDFTIIPTATVSFDCNSTLSLASTNSITVPVFNYGHLSLTGGPRTFSAGSTYKICGNYTPSTFATTTTGSTIEFSGTAAQAINTNAASFSDLVISNASNTVTSNVDLTIEPGSTVTINANARLSTGQQNFSITGANVQVNGYLRSANVIGADATTLVINNGGTFEYNETRSGQADLGIIPTATWNAGSTLSITGLTNPLNGAWFAGGMAQAFSNFSWNTTSLSSEPRLDAVPLSISNTFSVISTGTGQLLLGGATGGTINCVNFSQSGGTLNMSDGPGNSSIHVSGSFSHTGGSITQTGTGNYNAIYFDGTAQQQLSGNTSGYSNIVYEFNNAAGYQVTGSVPVQGNAIVKAGFFSGTGSLYFTTNGTLTYDCASPRTPGLVEWPASGYPHNVVVTNAVNLQLNASKSANQLTLNNGKITLGSYNLALYDSLGQGVIPATPFSTSNMVVTNGSGKLGRAIANTQSLPITYLFPIGNNF
jgi:hypothetical protein